MPIILWFYNLGKKEDITVVIGVKNRFDHRLENAFKSIRSQDYPQKLIKITLVDYDSDKKLIAGVQQSRKEAKSGKGKILISEKEMDEYFEAL